MLAFTGLGRSRTWLAETRELGEPCRGASSWGSASRAISFLIAIVATSAFTPYPDPDGPGGYATDLGTCVAAGALVVVAAAFSGELPAAIVDALRIFVGLTGTLILVAVVTTFTFGAGRLAYRSAGTTCSCAPSAG